MKYDFAAVEKKWQDIWEKENTFAASNDYTKPKFYALVEFPYPSGQGLHVGTSALLYRAGYSWPASAVWKAIMFSIPWAGTPLACPPRTMPSRIHIHPEIVTKSNVANFKQQLKSLGLSFDWTREINTTDPDYYKWTQWIFLQLFKHGLAYKKEMSVNWCTSCKCVLANEEVVGGVCERCGGEVVHKVKSQWMLRHHRVCPAPDR